MSTVEEIETAVIGLSYEDYGSFRRWLSKYDNDRWDEEMTADANAGKLDDLAREAMADLVLVGH